MALKKDLIRSTNKCLNVDKPGVVNTSRLLRYRFLAFFRTVVSALAFGRDNSCSKPGGGICQ